MLHMCDKLALRSQRLISRMAGEYLQMVIGQPVAVPYCHKLVWVGGSSGGEGGVGGWGPARHLTPPPPVVAPNSRAGSDDSFQHCAQGYSRVSPAGSRCITILRCRRMQISVCGGTLHSPYTCYGQ